MPRIGRIDLISADPAGDCGAAFKLASPPARDAILGFGGTVIEVRQGQRDAVVRFRGATGADDAYEKGHTLVQRGLDLLSMLGQADLAIIDAEEEHLLWWSEAVGLVLRIVSTATVRFAVGPASLEVRDPQGRIVPSTRIEPDHHIAFRFYRLAQTSDDLYDAYRNMYLAFEVLLSSRFPVERREGERDWLKRALQGASSDVHMTDLVPDAGDPAQAIIDIVYRKARLPLFHAKEGREFYAPQDSPADRKVVSDALKTLTLLVIRMAEAWFKTRRLSGGVSLGWIHRQAAEQLAHATMIASDDPSAFDASEKDLNHSRFKTGVKMRTRLAPELQLGSAPAVFSVSESTELSRLPILRRLDLITTVPYTSQLLEAECGLDLVARLEVVSHFRVMNSSQPKSLFKA